MPRRISPPPSSSRSMHRRSCKIIFFFYDCAVSGCLSSWLEQHNCLVFSPAQFPQTNDRHLLVTLLLPFPDDFPLPPGYDRHLVMWWNPRFPKHVIQEMKYQHHPHNGKRQLIQLLPPSDHVRDILSVHGLRPTTKIGGDEEEEEDEEEEDDSDEEDDDSDEDEAAARAPKQPKIINDSLRNALHSELGSVEPLLVKFVGGTQTYMPTIDTQKTSLTPSSAPKPPATAAHAMSPNWRPGLDIVYSKQTVEQSRLQRRMQFMQNRGQVLGSVAEYIGTGSWTISGHRAVGFQSQYVRPVSPSHVAVSPPPCTVYVAMSCPK